MKRLILAAGCLLLLPGLRAQTANDYFLAPGASVRVPVNGTVRLVIGQLNASGDPLPAGQANIGITSTTAWSLNGHPGDASSSEGRLTPDLTFLRATYQAPAALPARNPVAVSVTFHPGDTARGTVTLVCHITVVDAAYQVRLEGEITGPEGLHYKITGDCLANLQGFADGTYGLMPADGTRHMQLTVATAGVPGKMELVSPLTYPISFALNIGNLTRGDAPAKMSIENFSPLDNLMRPVAENYQTPGGIISLPTNLNAVFSGVFYQVVTRATVENGQKAREDMSFVQRLKAHENDPAYLRSAQGKSDLQQMQKLMQEHGRGTQFTQGMTSSSAGSSDYGKAFVQGMQGTQTDPSAYGPAPNANTATVMGGLFHFEGTFHKSGATALDISQDASPAGGLEGHLKITVIRLHPGS
ncbi:MAG TPA: hypothetical protein VG870_02545 [Chitinophagaceae bacterium]|nr:hypothetical protein [Chitinophagaceae bacterium]